MLAIAIPARDRMTASLRPKERLARSRAAIARSMIFISLLPAFCVYCAFADVVSINEVEPPAVLLAAVSNGTAGDQPRSFFSLLLL